VNKPVNKPDPKNLTARQRRILEVIRDAVVLRGYPPSIREIGDAAGLQSTSSVAYQLKELEKKGFLRRDPKKPRAVDVRHLPDADAPKTVAEPHLPGVMAALAVARHLQDTTGISIKRIIRTLKPLQDVTINLNGHKITAQPQITPNAASILKSLQTPGH